MPKSDFSEFRQQGLMSQTLSDIDPLFREIAGNDPESAKAIGYLIKLDELGFIDFERDKDGKIKNMIWALIMALLDVNLKVSFATSDKTNEITKMGLRMPRKESVYDGLAD